MSDFENALVRARDNGVAAVDMSLVVGNTAEAAQFQANLNNMGTGGAILRYSGNTGVFSHREEVFEHGTELAFDMAHIEDGFVCWKGGKLVDRALRPVVSRAPRIDQSTLADYGPYKEGEGWSNAMRVTVRRLDNGMEYELLMSSMSGVNALSALMADWGAKVRMQQCEDGTYKIPIVEIGARAFEPKNSPGKKYAPQFKIAGWLSEAEASEILAENIANEEVEPEQEPEPPKSTKVTVPASRRRFAG